MAAGGARSLTDDQDELATHVSGLACALGLGRLVERERLLDRHPQPPRFVELGSLAERLPGTLVRPAGDAHAVLGGAGVGGRHDVVRAARDLDQVHERAASGGVQRPIDAVRGELTNTVDHALAVGGRLGAERAQELVIGLAGGADDARPAGPGELHGRAPHPAGGPVDENRLVRNDAQKVECPHGRLGRRRQPCGLGPREPGGLGGVVAQQRVLGRAAAHGQAEHLIADGHVVDAVADLVHHAGRLLARDARKLDPNELRHRPAAHLPIDRIDPYRPDRHPHLPRAGMRLRDLADMENVRTPVLVEQNGPHVSLHRRSESALTYTGATPVTSGECHSRWPRSRPPGAV